MKKIPKTIITSADYEQWKKEGAKLAFTPGQKRLFFYIIILTVLFSVFYYRVHDPITEQEAIEAQAAGKARIKGTAINELAKDYVFWRTRILIYAKQGKTEKADKARNNFRGALYALEHGGYTEAEISGAIKYAEDYYQANPVR